MRRVLSALLATLVLLVVVLVPAPAQADRGCIITVAGVRVCGELLGEPLPEIIEVPGPTVTIPVPGPTRTVTNPVPVPGPTRTVTETVPGPTETVTVSPGNPQPTPDAVGPTETETQTNRITETVTETATVSPRPSPSQPDNEADDGLFDDTTIVEEVGIGLATLLGLVSLLLLGMYAGYALGYKDKERKETNFMRALLEQTKLRK